VKEMLMTEGNLIIVESPAKAKTIEKFLGKDFLVKSSFGHIRDLDKKNLGIEINNRYKPVYIISPEKKKIVEELKKLSKKADLVWLATDEDREGEAIAWHLFNVLALPEEKTRRIVFHEITRDAILNALKNPRFIDTNLVNAQQARRLLDRLVGFELSPLLWRKIKPALSAGRVQSVAVKLLVEREREINAFKSSSSFRIIGHFSVPGQEKFSGFQAELEKKLPDLNTSRDFLEQMKGASFSVADVSRKPSRKSPSPPFTTSTLQQDAGRKLGFSVAQTMTIAQRLYEAGKISYMRTDSVNLSDLALGAAAKEIRSLYGEKYLHTRNYKTKTKGAQEAHEAIRPTYLGQQTISGTQAEKKLYELIWKRTVASQMSDAELEKTTIRVSNNSSPLIFVATGEVIKFDGFLKLYMESQDDESEEESKDLLPPLNRDDKLDLVKMEASQKFTTHPPRYTEASLVKKLEELGIGRPSTYAPTISTIQNREYVLKEDRQGDTRKCTILTLRNGLIQEAVREEKYGFEKSKLFPTDIGMIVNDFLEQYFDRIMNYNFTATVEEEFDMIAEGKADWTEMIDRFYKTFHKKVLETDKTSEKTKGERLLGKDPATGKPVFVKIGRYGPLVQVGDSSDDKEKPKFASLLKGQSLETISLDAALDLFGLPRSLGSFEGSELIVGTGRFGPYIKHQNKYYSLKKDVDDPLKISLERAIELIEEKKAAEKNKIIRSFPEMESLLVLNGKYGPYISFEKNNYKIPKTKNPAELTLDECLQIIKSGSEKRKSRK
jgi:DNA topoisomerase-1